jgi:hypothetical protein
MHLDQGQFEDPQLASAIRRAWGTERAPAELRRRISSLVPDPAGAGAIAGRIAPSTSGSRRWFRYAAAAVILLAIGTITFTARNRLFQSSPHQEAYSELKPDMAKLMTHTHDAAAINPRLLTATGGNGSEFESLGRTLQIELGRRIAMVPLAGWNFVGARLAQIGDMPAAQMLFSHDDEYISVFSLDVPQGYPAEDGISYEQTFEGHPISGFVRAGGLYCLVGSSKSGKLDVEELEELRDQVHARMSARPTTPYTNPKIPPTLLEAVKQR